MVGKVANKSLAPTLQSNPAQLNRCASGMFMKNIVVIFVIATLSGCMATAPSRTLLAPKSGYNQIGATVYSPSETGWSLAQSNNYGVAFGKQYGNTDETAVANTVIFKVEGFENDKEFLDYIASQREKQDDRKRFKILS